MTEKEYITIKALGTITAVINALKDLTPENLTEVIKEGEYSQVMPTLYNWRDRLSKQIEIED